MISFESIGNTFHNVLLTLDYSKESDILHLDGVAALKKEEYNSRCRQEDQERIDKARISMANNNKRQTSAYIIRSLTLPQEMKEATVRGLQRKNWTVHVCLFQSDTCTTNAYQVVPNLNKLTTISTDSDYLAYQYLPVVIDPRAPGGCIAYIKKGVIDDNRLGDSVKFLLVSVVTSNDYSQGVPFFGFVSNIHIIQSLVLVEAWNSDALEEEKK
ncbi:hypothetical protein BG015_002782 [Linnemannia schmuckeri]|uniref:Uncharacterized protein n=1 Tax=Linnemannia schmuckeri TaxID=64567 RepID=A0A9P5RNM2_9FUNG|nr:hypothetical protein BG015_002782 [Linnemannia schmuckeri]